MPEMMSRAPEMQLGSDPAAAIRLRVAEYLPHIDIGGGDVLVGVWLPDKGADGYARSAGGVLFSDKARQEFQFQGVTGLVLKLGPLAYKTEKTERWFDESPKVGDWVSFNFKQGEAFLLRDQPCRLVSDQYVLMRVPRPDLIA